MWCSIYVVGVDVVELELTLGTKTVSVRNNDNNLLNQLSDVPGLNLGWFDKVADAYGATLSTDGVSLPGWAVSMCTLDLRVT